MEINVLIEDGLEGNLETSWLENLAQQVLITQGVTSEAELDLAIVGEGKIRQLNSRYLGEDEPTDVLAFPMLPGPSGKDPAPFVLPPDGVQHLGEVIIAYPQAALQAEEHQHSTKREIAILLIHGVLHLLGYDHDEPEREQQMKAREAEILSHLESEAR